MSRRAWLGGVGGAAAGAGLGSLVNPVMAEELKASQIPNAYLDHYYSAPLQIGVSLWALGDTEFRAVLPLRTERTSAGGLRLAQAA